jgi:2'-5' RNA ligase
MRLFFGIPLNHEVGESLAGLQARLAATRAEVRWSETSKYHLTVKFLGETDEKFLPELSSRLDRAAAQVPQFPIDIEGLGRLPEKGPARVIIAYAYSPDQRLTKLHRLIDSAAGGIGLPMDTRELLPHVTLGRVQSNHGLNRLLRIIEKHAGEFIGSFSVERVQLIASTLTPEASVYRVLHESPLAPAPVARYPREHVRDRE